MNAGSPNFQTNLQSRRLWSLWDIRAVTQGVVRRPAKKTDKVEPRNAVMIIHHAARGG